MVTTTAATTTTTTMTNTDMGQWQYHLTNSVDGKKIGWHNYAPDANQKLEQKWSQQQTQHVVARTTWHLKSGFFDYEVNLGDMTQRNMSTATVRAIRRIIPKSAHNTTRTTLTTPKSTTTTTTSTTTTTKHATTSTNATKKNNNNTTNTTTTHNSLTVIKITPERRAYLKAQRRSQIMATIARHSRSPTPNPPTTTINNNNNNDTTSKKIVKLNKKVSKKSSSSNTLRRFSNRLHMIARHSRRRCAPERYTPTSSSSSSSSTSSSSLKTFVTSPAGKLAHRSQTVSPKYSNFYMFL